MEREEFMEKYKDVIERLSLDDLSFCLRSGLEVLYDKLRKEGFDCDIQFAGNMDNGDVRLYCISTNGTCSGSPNFQQVFRV